MINNSEIENKIDQIFSLCANSTIKSNSLMGGRTGIALFYFYYAKYKNSQEAYDLGYNMILHIIDSANKNMNLKTYADGLAGIGWVIHHLSKHDFLDADTNSLLGSIDSKLSRWMLREINEGRYDYLHGALGVAMYLASRIRNNKVFKSLNLLIDKLDLVSHKVIAEIKWSSEINYKTGESGFNISLSHGMSGIVLILTKLFQYEVNAQKLIRLVDGANTYILNQKLTQWSVNSLYPGFSIESSKKITSSRLAWCYGDLGISLALWYSAQSFGRYDWEKESISIMKHASKRKDLRINGVVDAGLCHGSAGISHIFRRMYMNTDIDELKQSADYWLDVTMDFARYKSGLAGFVSYRSEKDGGPINEYGLLDGIAGIGLSLISAVSDFKPAWDECLLLS